MQKKNWPLLALHGADATGAGLPLGPVRTTSTSPAAASGAAAADVSGFPKASLRASLTEARSVPVDVDPVQPFPDMVQ